MTKDTEVVTMTTMYGGRYPVSVSAECCTNMSAFSEHVANDTRVNRYVAVHVTTHSHDGVDS